MTIIPWLAKNGILQFHVVEFAWFRLAHVRNTIEMYLAVSNIIPRPAQHARIWVPSHTFAQQAAAKFAALWQNGHRRGTALLKILVHHLLFDRNAIWLVLEWKLSLVLQNEIMHYCLEFNTSKIISPKKKTFIIIFFLFCPSENNKQINTKLFFFPFLLEVIF